MMAVPLVAMMVEHWAASSAEWMAAHWAGSSVAMWGGSSAGKMAAHLAETKVASKVALLVAMTAVR